MSNETLTTINATHATPTRVFALIGSALLVACAHSGVGIAVAADAARASVEWHSGLDRGRGRLQVRLHSGESYVGEFAQFRAELGSATLGTYFVRWSAPAWAADPWFGGPPKECLGVNSKKAIALLHGPRGTVMRCRLELRDPDAGLASGAEGECELSQPPMRMTIQID